MNKYKKGFTPDEVALIAIDFEKYIDLDSVEDDINQMLDNSLSLKKYFPAGEIIYANEWEEEAYVESYVKGLISEARDIRDALRSEVLLAYEDEHSEKAKKTILEIYQLEYTSSDRKEICTSNTQLTKASLAKWFAAADQEYASNKFNDKKLARINIFKREFVAEHAALVAVGLEYFSSIYLAKVELNTQNENISEDEDEGYISYSSIYDAENIKKALIDEIQVALDNGLVADRNKFNISRATDIEIYSNEEIDSNEVDLNSILITKQSIAIWLWNNGQVEYAKNVLANIEVLIQETDTSKKEPHIKGFPNNTSTKAVMPIRTPESSLIDSIGIMAWLLSKKVAKFERGDKPNASQIMTAIENAVLALELNQDSESKIMLSNLNKDITLSLRQLEGRFKL